MSILAAIIAVPAGVVSAASDAQRAELLDRLAEMSESEQQRIYRLIVTLGERWPKEKK